jgi:pimeloyl-ACP methyl ester carboxylesterase
MPFNIPTQTLGGQQFWSDVVHFHKWRIQENVLTGHFRLLDPRNVRQAWGTRQECQDKLDEVSRQQGLAPMTGRVVLVLHGLGRGWSKMDVIAKTLEEAGYAVCNISYASTRRGLDDHARTLKSVVDNLPEVDEFYIVGHSLGNIVARRYLHDLLNSQGQCQDARFKRMVMLGPPNQGARMAAIFGDNALFSLVTGASGVALGAGWKEVESTLATPPFEFGIIAGAGHPLTPPNPLIEGDDDFLVAVEETKLPGASDFIVLPTNHATMTADKIVLDAMLSFLKEGYFVSEAKKQPLPKN